MKYQKGFKYQLVETLRYDTGIVQGKDVVTHFIELSPTGILSIKEGYAWDGASGPTIDTKSSMRAALVHDALYQLMRQEYLDIEYRHAADRILRDILIKDGMWKWRANIWYKAVRKAAKEAALPKNKRKTYTA